MAVYVISDLHLSHSAAKPMDIFGAAWKDHTERLKTNWENTVSESDTVIIPGDVSWGMDMSGTCEDLLFLQSLPGRKIIGKGNHDYWWNSMKKLNEYKNRFGLSTIDFLYNNAYNAENITVFGSRGWLTEEAPDEQNKKIIDREAVRLSISLEEAKKICGDREPVAFMHYPPAFSNTISRPIMKVLRDSGAKRCYYGHLHNVRPYMLNDRIDGIELILVSADHLNFTPLKITE